MYGLKRPSDDQGSKEENDDEEEEVDIETSIKQELSRMKETKPKTRQQFPIVSTDLECVLFIKTMKPVDPVEFVRKICEDARDCPDIMKRKTKYINRLTPVTDMDKATENGIISVARAAMAPHFRLTSEGPEGEAAESAAPEEPKADESGTNFTVCGPLRAQCDIYSAGLDGLTDVCWAQYAIRHSIRSHTTFKSDAVIKKIAGIVRPEHKVNLTKPDKVVLVEIYQVRQSARLDPPGSAIMAAPGV